jgi:hypothetical protein
MLGVSQISPVLSFAALGGFLVAMLLLGSFLFNKIRI